MGMRFRVELPEQFGALLGFRVLVEDAAEMVAVAAATAQEEME